MNCECNDNSNRVKPRIKHVYGNVLRMAIPLTLRTLVKDGDEMIVNDTDFIPSSDHLVRVVLSKGKTNYPITATMDGNVAIIEDKGKIPEGTYDISVECYDDLGNPYRFKQNAVLYVADTTAEAGIDEEIEYEAQTWYLNAAVFLATTEIGEIGDVIDAKLDDVFGNVLYDANAKEIRFYNKGNSRVLATIDSRPFVVDGTVADVYIDVSRQVLVVVLNEDAGGRRFSVPLYLVFNSYYKKDEVDSLVSRTVENVRLDFSQELPFVVHVTQDGSSFSSDYDFCAIGNAIMEDGRVVVACVNNTTYLQLLVASGEEIIFSQVFAEDSIQTLLRLNDLDVWSMEDVDLGTSGGGGGYEPPVGGIPKTDLASDVQASLGKADTALQAADKTQLQAAINAVQTALNNLMNGASVTDAIDTFNEVVDFLNDIDTDDPTLFNQLKSLSDAITALQTALAGKISGIKANGASTTLPVDQDGVVELPPAGSTISPATAAPLEDGTASVGSSAKYAREDHVHPHDSTKLSKSDVSVETQGDGTVDINVGSGANKDSYTINLNHTHEGMAKLVKCTEATLPQTLEDDTIYVQVDNLTTPTEIEALHIFGLEFTGGGLPAGTPAITKPSGTTINLGGNSGSGVSKTIEIKANSHITGGLTVGLAANSDLSFDTTNLPSGVTYNSGAGTLTIEQLPAMQGVNITVVYSGSGGAEIDGGIIITGGGASPKSMTVIVEELPVVIGGIKLTGTQWLKTDYCPGPNTQFSLKCKFTENSNTNTSGYDYSHDYFLCCPYDGNYRFSFYTGEAGGNPWRFLAANENNSNPPQINVGRSTIQTDNSYLNLVKGASSFTLEFLAGGVTPTQYTATLPLKTTTMPQPLEIGHLSSKTSGEGIFGVYDLTIYELKIYEGGRTDDFLVRHYVPRTIGNVPGLYDLKTHGFISSETGVNVEIVQ